MKNKIFHTQGVLAHKLEMRRKSQEWRFLCQQKIQWKIKSQRESSGNSFYYSFSRYWWGTFFQQLYNTVDAVIVGRFVGKEALSCVSGSSGQIINLVVGFLPDYLPAQQL